jgi:hypothetical protein
MQNRKEHFMTRFNSPAVGTKTTNLAGGEGYSESPQLELISLLLTSMVQDSFYESANANMDRLKELIKRNDPKFAAKAAIYTRNEFGLRSISHVTAGEIAALVKGQPWTRKFYEKVVRRVDDMTEILSYYLSQYGKPIPNSLKRGLADAFDKFDEYQLSKYRAEGKTLSLVDVVNLVHPVPSVKTSDALAKLVKGELKSTKTWESKLTKAGQTAESEEDKAEKKAASWKEMVEGKQLGYFALLRNLRNIMDQAPGMLPPALKMLVDPKLIKKSLVLPFRFQTAIDEFTKSGDVAARQVLIALSQAVEISLDNVPEFDGLTLVAVDESGSMQGRPIEMAALFAGALLKSNNAVLMLFANEARYKTINPSDSLGTIQREIMRDYVGAGTNFHTIFVNATQKYDRIIILSDMQGWRDGHGYYSDGNPSSAFADYKKRTGADPHVYSFDLVGNGTLMFPERNVYALAGFSEKVFDLMKALEQDRKALVKTIENYCDL